MPESCTGIDCMATIILCSVFVHFFCLLEHMRRVAAEC